MAKLVRTVRIGGQAYGPAHGSAEPPEEVARQITNPLAWENGEVPYPAEESAGESSAPAAQEPARIEIDSEKAAREVRFQGDENTESAPSARASRARKKG